VVVVMVVVPNTVVVVAVVRLVMVMGRAKAIQYLVMVMGRAKAGGRQRLWKRKLRFRPHCRLVWKQ